MEFLKHLKVDLVIGVFGSFILVLTTMFIFENLMYCISRLGSKYIYIYYPFREGLSYIGGIVFQRDLAGKAPLNWSARTLSIIYAVGMTIIMTSYTANLTARNISGNQDSGFKSLQKDERVR